MSLVHSKPAIFALQAAVKFWYHFNYSTGKEVIFSNYKEEKR